MPVAACGGKPLEIALGLLLLGRVAEMRWGGIWNGFGDGLLGQLEP